MPVLRNGRQIGIMSQADEGEAGASQQTAVILSPLDEFKMKNEVAKQLRAGGAFNGDRSKTKGFVERVERMFGGSVGDYLSPKLRAEAVVESFGPEVEKSFGLVRTAELLSSWDNVKEWIQSNYGDPNNPRLEAVRVLKKISFVGRSVPKETERLAEAFKELGMDPKTAALFYVDAMSEESVFDFMSQYGRVFENWDFQELVATVNPMAEKFNQKAKQARGGPTDKPAYTPKPPTKRSGGGFNYAAMLESLSAVKWLTGDYKPANVEALKAKLDDTNPDSEKSPMSAAVPLYSAASRRCEVTWSWFSEANQAGLDLKMDQKMEFNTQLNVSELNTYSVVAEPTVGWSSEPTFAAVKDDAVPLTTVYNAVLNKKNVRVLIDNGSSFNIVSESFVRKNEWQTNAAAAVNVTLADGRRHSGDRVLRNSKLKLGCVSDTLNLRVYPVQNYDVILGVPWLIKMKANIDFSSGDLVVLKNGRVKKIKSATTVAKESNAGRRPDWLLSKKSFKKLLKRTDELERHNTHSVCYMIEGEHIEGLLLAEKDLGFSMQTPNRPAGVAVTADNYATATTADNDVSKKIERLLSDYADLFPTSSPGLPPERGIVHEIKLKQGTAPVHRTPYRMSVAQEDELRKRLKELLDLGLIRHSKSPWASPVLFVPKKDGSLRFCVDYRGLNKVTVRDEHSLPIVEDQIRRLTGAKVFSKVDCFNGFYQIAMAAADVEKTAFTTPYGLFEFLVMPFGLNNAPATFSRLMMNIFQDYINDFVLVYMDDILIFSKDEAEHETHLKLVLDRLREKGLVAKKSKCSFFKTDIDYLGFVVSADGVKMAADKVQAVLEWPTPSNASEVRGFLGLSGFYRNFIRNYAHIVAPLNELTKKNMVYIWTPLHAKRFDELKRAVTTAPVLQVYDPTQQCVVCTDASNIAVGAVLMQAASDGSGAAPKPVAFFSRKLRGAELNYDARTKEFLAIKLTAHKWRHYLNNGETPIFFTDHESLQYLNTSTELSPKFMRWFSSITSWLGGPPTIRYKPGKLNVVADALSRRPDHSHCLYALSLVVPADELMQQIRDGLKVDEFALAEAEKIANKIDSKYFLENELLYRFVNNRLQLYVPKVGNLRELIISEMHDLPIVGHQGWNRTLRRIIDQFGWPGISKDVQAYVDGCSQCGRSKPRSRFPAGLLQPLELPNEPWESVSMDFIVKLPKTKEGFDAVMVVVDRFSKYVEFIPTFTTATAEETAFLFFKEILCRYGCPASIVSDRDSKFISSFWQSLWSSVGTRLKMSTSYHPQTDGQTERVNRVLEEMLRSFCVLEPETWVNFLPQARFAYNTAVTNSTKMSPFEVVHGHSPRLPTSYVAGTSSAVPVSVERFRERHEQTISQVTKFLTIAQDKQTLYANKKRVDVSFDVGDEVLLNSRNLSLDGTNPPKLKPLFVGPFKILKKIGPVAYTLDMPPSFQGHTTFHVSVLKKAPNTDARFPLRAATSKPPPLYFQRGDAFYEVEKIISHRGKPPNRTLRVKWKGYTTPTWEPEANFLNNEFYLKYFAELTQRRGRR
ncbi:putative Transposon Tf2-6 polyprotein [Nannochloris sp. 'desiccata']|nr:putative Transposon Tf2-6 polyprotein [Chlorella desiccata (nom. nud.)]